MPCNIAPPLKNVCFWRDNVTASSFPVSRLISSLMLRKSRCAKRSFHLHWSFYVNLYLLFNCNIASSSCWSFSDQNLSCLDMLKHWHEFAKDLWYPHVEFYCCKSVTADTSQKREEITALLGHKISPFYIFVSFCIFVFFTAETRMWLGRGWTPMWASALRIVIITI